MTKNVIILYIISNYFGFVFDWKTKNLRTLTHSSFTLDRQHGMNSSKHNIFIANIETCNCVMRFTELKSYAYNAHLTCTYQHSEG